MKNPYGVTMNGENKHTGFNRVFVLVDNAECMCGAKLHCGVSYYRDNRSFYMLHDFFVKCMDYCGNYNFNNLTVGKQAYIPEERDDSLFLGN